MDAKIFVKMLNKIGIDFFTGVPDSQLKSFNNYLMNTYGISKNHIITANEGNAVALAAGYHLSTGKIPCVYLQNSGLGNIVNPITSLISDKVYGIPCIFVIGWRGEPGVKDEPQHLFQGEITTKLLKLLNIEFVVLDKEIDYPTFEDSLKSFHKLLNKGKSVAFVVKKDALTYKEKVTYENNHLTTREEVIKCIVDRAHEDIIISTTGKTSRELFEIREQKKQSHKLDFLCVGSMGHSSSIALGIALNKPDKRIWCLDGDGSVLMHMGALAIIADQSPNNFVHILLNNEAHESVGGQPTASSNINFIKVAEGCGYKEVYSVDNIFNLNEILKKLNKMNGPIFIEVKVKIGSRNNLGRPTKSPLENKKAFMENIVERLN